MCVISDKIKFCTCLTDDVDVETLNHYWVLYEKSKGDVVCLVLGLVGLPTEFQDKHYHLNVSILENRLNDPDAFDFQTNFKNGEVIEIVINNCSKKHPCFTYTFKFSRGKWKHYDVGNFELQSDFDEKAMGKLKSVLNAK
jgi:hypothetical protein